VGYFRQGFITCEDRASIPPAMRHSNPAIRGSRPAGPAIGPGARASTRVGLVLLAVVLVACGPSAAASASPTPIPTPAITPDPHLKDPVAADAVYLAITSGHLTIYPNSTTTGPSPIVQRIYADLDAWPLRITTYASAGALRKAQTWNAGDAPGRGEAPYTLAALNVLIEYGPTSASSAPARPDAGHQQTAEKLVTVLDPLLWPIAQHSVVTIAARSAPPAGATLAPGATPSRAAASARPAATATP
jgi:hypothetical protein